MKFTFEFNAIRKRVNITANKGRVLGFTQHEGARKNHNAMIFSTLSLNKKVKQHLLF